PNEVVMHIYSFLDPKEAARFRAVSQRDKGVIEGLLRDLSSKHLVSLITSLKSHQTVSFINFYLKLEPTRDQTLINEADGERALIIFRKLHDLNYKEGRKLISFYRANLTFAAFKEDFFTYINLVSSMLPTYENVIKVLDVLRASEK